MLHGEVRATKKGDSILIKFLFSQHSTCGCSEIMPFIVDLVQATRFPDRYGLEEMNPLIEYGASPRATIFLARAARAHAFIQRRGYVTPEDVKAVGADVLRHRIIASYEAEAEEIDSEQIVQQLFDHIEVP